jgi:hypothetical protein
MVTFRKVLILSVAGLCALGFFLAADLDFWNYNHLPKVPDENTGHIHRMVVSHGSVRFGTDHDVRLKQLIHNGTPVAGIIFLLDLLIGLHVGVFHIRGQKPMENKGTIKPS